MKSNEKPVSMIIPVAARSSPLSRVQLKEVLDAIQKIYPHIEFSPFFVETHGDKDQFTSLRQLDKTDFFTREVDALVLNKQCRVAIHSAKDLPASLPSGLHCIALTKGIDSSDSLVFRQNETLETLRPGAIVATSSERREAIVKSLRPDLTFKDIRGTIQQRLDTLKTGTVDAVVIAEAALIRLKLTFHSRIRLPGDTTPGQGQLAIIAREDDEEMNHLFKPLDTLRT